MLYEVSFSGECEACGHLMDGFVRDVPRGERIVVFLCGECGRVTGWAPAVEARRNKPGNIVQSIVSPTPPARCPNCEGESTAGGELHEPSFHEWRTLRIAWEQVDRKEDVMRLTDACWECGKPTAITWKITRQTFFSANRHGMDCLMWGVVVVAIVLSPLLLLLSPLIMLGWVVWHWLTGKCLRCGHMYTCYSSMPLAAEDGGGELRRCPRCGTFYYLPIMGPVAERRVSLEEVRKTWPEAIKKAE